MTKLFNIVQNIGHLYVKSFYYSSSNLRLCGLINKKDIPSGLSFWMPFPLLMLITKKTGH